MSPVMSSGALSGFAPASPASPLETVRAVLQACREQEQAELEAAVEYAAAGAPEAPHAPGAIASMMAPPREVAAASMAMPSPVAMPPAAPAARPTPPAFSVPVAHELPNEPYRGLNPFRFVDSDLFFGREADLLKLVRGLVVYRGMLLYGAQGVGKSSLLNAGLVPELVGGGFVPERLRVQPVPGAEIVVERISRHDSGAPPYLPSLLVTGDERTPRPTMSAGTLLERLRALPPTARPVLIFDQMEELVTRFEDAPPQADHAAALAAQRRVVDAIVGTMLGAHVRARVLVAFREDYLARVAALFSRVPELQDQAVRLLAPGIDDLEAIIRGPIARFPERYGARFPAELPAALRQAFAERLRGAPVVLSEVQIASLQLWKSPDPLALLAREDGLESLLREYLTAQIARFSPDEQEAIGAMLSAMVTSGGARNIVSREHLLERLRGATPLDDARLEALLARIDGGETQLVRRERRQDVEYYTIVSEFLIPWIRAWREQRVKAAADRQVAETIEREEAKRARQQARWMRAAVGVAVLVAVGAVAFSFSLMRANDEVNRLRTEDRLRNLATLDSIQKAHRAEVDSAIAASIAVGDVRQQLELERQARAEAQLALKNAQARIAALQAATSAAASPSAFEQDARRWLAAALGDKDPEVRAFAQRICAAHPATCEAAKGKARY